jgi:hypothetical protein
MDFPSHVSEVSDICGDLNDFLEEGLEVASKVDETPLEVSSEVAESAFHKFIREVTPRIFVNIFPSLKVINVDYKIDINMRDGFGDGYRTGGRNNLSIRIISKSYVFTIVFSLLKMTNCLWSVRFEPLLCSPLVTGLKDIDWIRFAYVTFEPSFFDYETILKKWLESNGSLFEYH